VAFPPCFTFEQDVSRESTLPKFVNFLARVNDGQWKSSFKNANGEVNVIHSLLRETENLWVDFSPAPDDVLDQLPCSSDAFEAPPEFVTNELMRPFKKPKKWLTFHGCDQPHDLVEEMVFLYDLDQDCDHANDHPTGRGRNHRQRMKLLPGTTSARRNCNALVFLCIRNNSCYLCSFLSLLASD